MTDNDGKDHPSATITLMLTPEMRENLQWLAKHQEVQPDDLALELFAAELEAQVGQARGPYLRKYMYRA